MNCEFGHNGETPKIQLDDLCEYENWTLEAIRPMDRVQCQPVYADFLRRKCTILPKARDYKCGCRDNRLAYPYREGAMQICGQRTCSRLFLACKPPQLNALELHVLKSRQNAVETAPDVVVPGLSSFTPPND